MGIAKDEVAVGALVPVFQGFNKLVVGIRLKVQRDGAGRVLAREDARESSRFVTGHGSCAGNQTQGDSFQIFTGSHAALATTCSRLPLTGGLSSAAGCDRFRR